MNEDVSLIVIFENRYAIVYKEIFKVMIVGNCNGSNDCVCNYYNKM